MKSIRDTQFYSQVLKEFNYHFGDFFVFEKFVVSEIKEGVVCDYSCAECIIVDLFRYLNTSDGASINFISNRVNSYSVMATDWLKFFEDGFSLNSYMVVSDKKRFSNAVIEKLFYKYPIKHFCEIGMAINFVKYDIMKIDS